MQDLTQGLGTTDPTNGANLNLGIDTGLIGTAVMVGTIVSIVLTVALVVYLIVNVAHRWKSEKAMVEMARNIQEIKVLLQNQVAEKTPSKPPAAPVVRSTGQVDQQRRVE